MAPRLLFPSSALLAALSLLFFASSAPASAEITVGQSFTGEATYYGAGNDRRSACGGYGKSTGPGGVTTVAINSRQWEGGANCGICIEGSGTGVGAGGNPVGKFFAAVNNLCPECKYGDIDFALNGDGRWKVNWKRVDCASKSGRKLMQANLDTAKFLDMLRGGGNSSSSSEASAAAPSPTSDALQTVVGAFAPAAAALAPTVQKVADGLPSETIDKVKVKSLIYFMVSFFPPLFSLAKKEKRHGFSPFFPLVLFRFFFKNSKLKITTIIITYQDAATSVADSISKSVNSKRRRRTLLNPLADVVSSVVSGGSSGSSRSSGSSNSNIGSGVAAIAGGNGNGSGAGGGIAAMAPAAQALAPAAERIAGNLPSGTVDKVKDAATSVAKSLGSKKMMRRSRYLLADAAEGTAEGAAPAPSSGGGGFDGVLAAFAPAAQILEPTVRKVVDNLGSEQLDKVKDAASSVADSISKSLSS